MARTYLNMQFIRSFSPNTMFIWPAKLLPGFARIWMSGLTSCTITLSTTTVQCAMAEATELLALRASLGRRQLVPRQFARRKLKMRRP